MAQKNNIRSIRFSDELAFAVEHRLVVGYDDGEFRPRDELSRGMIVTILYNLEGRPDAPASTSFTDVPAGKYYTDAIAWAAASNIVGGYGDGTFRPNEEVTREQMAAILYFYAAYKGFDVSGQADLSGYTDEKAIHSWALAGMRWANSASLVVGRTTTTLDPDGNSMRVEAAVLFAKFCQQIAGME